MRGGGVFDGQDVFSLEGDHLDISYRVDEVTPPLIAGPDGCQFTRVVADRRHQPADAG
jgi:hypothetical protein